MAYISHTQTRTFIYEALFFLAVDSSLRNVPVSAFLTYFFSRLLIWAYGLVCRNNLSQKTMIDRHFLI
jgi:meckelin